MNAITSKYLVAIDSHIASRIAISKAQSEFVVGYNTFTKEEQGEARNAIAQRISERTGVKCITMDKGSNKGLLGFKAKQAGGSDKSEAARTMLVYYTPKAVVEKSSTTSNQVDTRAKRADSIIRDEQTKRDVDKLVADIYAAWARKQAKKAAK